MDVEREKNKSIIKVIIFLLTTIIGFIIVSICVMSIRGHYWISIYPFYSVVVIFASAFLSLAAGIVIAVLSSILGVLSLIFIGGLDRLIIFLEIALIWCVVYLVYKYFKREEYEESVETIELEKLDESINTIQIEYRKNTELYTSLGERIEKYKNLSQVARTLSSTFDTERLEGLVISMAKRLVGKGNFVLKNFNKKEMKSQADYFDKWIIEHKVPLLVRNVNTDFRFKISDCSDDIRSLIAVPIVHHWRVNRILRIQDKSVESFREEELRLLSILGDLASMALYNAYLYQRTEELAITDSLTKLYTYRHLQELLEREFLRAKRFKTSLSVLMIDIDYFKKYNDAHGHIAGDYALRKIADILRQNFRETDILGRYGGEEFCIIMPMTNKNSALSSAKALREAVEREKFIYEKARTRLTVSIGLATFYLNNMENKSELIFHADQALFKAKHSGRNAVKT